MFSIQTKFYLIYDFIFNLYFDFDYLFYFLFFFFCVESSFVLGMDKIKLTPDEHDLLKYTNESYVVECSTQDNLSAVRWVDPTGNEISSKNPLDRIHVVDRTVGSNVSLVLVFTRFVVDDAGNYTCMKVDGRYGAMQWFQLKIKGMFYLP